MKYKAESEANRRYLEDSKVPEELIYKRMMHDLIEKIPIEELGKLFTMSKIDPEQIVRSNRYYDLKEHEIEEMKFLRQREGIKYKISIEIPD